MPASAEALIVAGVALVVAARFGGRVAAFGLAVVVGDVLRVRRAHAEAAMARANVPDPSRTACGMYRSLARGLVELLGMVFVDPGRRLSTAFPWAAVESQCGPGRGAVVATAHTGNWDLVACAVASRTPLTVVTKRLHVRALDALWQGARRARGLRLVGAGNAARPAAAALRRGELVAMLVDQAPERRRGAVEVPFLGAPAWVDLAPALCALRARVPLVVAFPRRLADGSHTIDVGAVLVPPSRPSRAWAIEATREATRLLDAFVRRHPEQWLWMHRRWKNAVPERAAPGSGGALAGVSS